MRNRQVGKWARGARNTKLKGSNNDNGSPVAFRGSLKKIRHGRNRRTRRDLLLCMQKKAAEKETMRKFKNGFFASSVSFSLFEIARYLCDAESGNRPCGKIRIANFFEWEDLSLLSPDRELRLSRPSHPFRYYRHVFQKVETFTGCKGHFSRCKCPDNIRQDPFTTKAQVSNLSHFGGL